MPDPYTGLHHDSELAALAARRADDTARWAGVPAAPLAVASAPRDLPDDTIPTAADDAAAIRDDDYQRETRL